MPGGIRPEEQPHPRSERQPQAATRPLCEHVASVTNWANQPSVDAPSVLRTASSRLRPSDRTSRRLITLTHAIGQQQRGAAQQKRRVGRISADNGVGRAGRRRRPGRGCCRDTGVKLQRRCPSSPPARARSPRRPSAGRHRTGCGSSGESRSPRPHAAAPRTPRGPVRRELKLAPAGRRRWGVRHAAEGDDLTSRCPRRPP